MSIAEASAAPSRRQPTSAVRRQIPKQFPGLNFEDLSADGNTHSLIRAFAAGTIGTLAMHSPVRNVLGVVAQVKQSIQRRISHQPNIPASSAVSARWSTARDEFLAPKGCYAVTTMSALHANLYAVDKHSNRKRREITH